jgi:DNA primase
VLKVALQMPGVAGPQFDLIDGSGFLVPVHQQLRAAIELAGGTASATGGPDWIASVEAAVADAAVRPTINELAVEPLRTELVSQERYADAILARFQWIVGAREIVKLKARVQRLNPVDHPEEYNRAFGELITLEAHVRVLGERAIGGS